MSWNKLILGLATAASLVRAGVVPGDPARFKYYEMETKFSGPCDTGSGPDSEVYIQEFLANKIVRLNQNNGQLTEYNIPFTVPAAPNISLPLPGQAKLVLLSCAIRTGFDGYMYFSNGAHNQLVRHDVHTGDTVVFTPPGLLSVGGNLEPLNDLTTAPDGVYFSQTSANVLTKFDYKTHRFQNFVVPTPLALPVGMYYASDGGIWFLEFAGNKIGRLDRASGAIREYSIAGPRCGPLVMRSETVDSNGNHMLWFACTLSSALGGINPATGKTIQVPTTTPESFPVEVAQDYHNNVWVSYLLQDRLGVYNTRTGNYTEITVPTNLVPNSATIAYLGSGIFSKPVGQPNSGSGVGNAVWFSQTDLNKVVRYDLNGFVVP